jgi:hypothetical protein
MDCEIEDFEDEDPSDEEKRLEILGYLNDGCWLADVVHKDSVDTGTVHEHDHAAFFAEDNPYFDYPEARLLNEMIKTGLLSVHISPWRDGGLENPHYNLRHFRLTDEGRRYITEHIESSV